MSWCSGVLSVSFFWQSDWLRRRFLAVVLATLRECVRRSVSCAKALVIEIYWFTISKPDVFPRACLLIIIQVIPEVWSQIHSRTKNILQDTLEDTLETDRRFILEVQIHQCFGNRFLSRFAKPSPNSTKRPLSDICLLRYKQNSFGCFREKSQFQFFPKTPKIVLLITQQPNIAQRPFCIQNERQDILYHLI